MGRDGIGDGGTATKAEIFEEVQRMILAEREACAKVCEATMTDVILGGNKDYNTGREMGATVCANKIRMRSNVQYTP